MVALKSECLPIRNILEKNLRYKLKVWKIGDQ